MRHVTTLRGLCLELFRGRVGARSISEQLLHVEPQTRKEQRCDGRAAGLIRRERKGFDPDEVVGYAFADSCIEGQTVAAPGAAIRSHGRWYRLSYVCRTTADGLRIEAFDYTLDAEIPRAERSAHFLVPR